jgi:hypothetical protein
LDVASKHLKEVRHGNKEVVAMMMRWLKEARRGRLMFAAVAACEGGDETGISYAGDFGVVPSIVTGLNMLSKELDHLHRKKQPGIRNHELDASFHEYNMATDANNWDFLVWLIDAEMTRVREDGMAPLKIAFTNIDKLTDNNRRFFEQVYRPLLPLLGAVEDPRAIGGRRCAGLTPYQICLAVKRGEKLPRLEAPQGVRLGAHHRLNGRKPVVITLRESEHWSKRNSNVPAWIRFARDLQAKGEDIIFVRDTAKANEPLEDFECWQAASFQVPARMALYQEAKCNLFVSNGPAGLGLFSDMPYLYFLRVYRDTEYEANNPDWWIRANGIGEGDQWPWATPQQRMIWKQDDYANLSEAWEQYGPALNASGSVMPTLAMSDGAAYCTARPPQLHPANNLNGAGH